MLRTTNPRLNTLAKLNIYSGVCENVETKGEIPPVRSGQSAVQWKNFMFVYGGWDAVISKNVKFSFDLSFSGHVQI